MSLRSGARLLMHMHELEQRWIHALDVAADALEAAARAHALPMEEVLARRDRLAVERAWVERVEWPAVDQRRATVTLLETPAKVARTRVVRPAA
jgi:hypothetical protein